MGENKEKKFPSDFFKENPKVEHVLYKHKDNVALPIEDITTHSSANTAFINEVKLESQYSLDNKPYIIAHNHTVDLEREHINSFPSFDDFVTFLLNAKQETMAIYQHNGRTNQTEGMYVIKKTSKTSHLDWSEKLDNERKTLFGYQSTQQDSLSNEARQKLLNEVIEKFNLKIKYISAEGFCYVCGVGFLKKEK